MDLISREELLKQPLDTSNYPSNYVKNAPSAFEGMTNGEVIISLYPNLKYTIQSGRVVTTIGVASSFDLDWWNAPYKAESEDK